MKKFNKFGFASAIVLAGAMGFAACSSDDEEFVELNPTFDGNSVKTQFAISLTKKANKGGRMATQEALPGDGSNVATFYGLTGMRLYQFADESINENAIFEKEQIFKVDETEFVTETRFDNNDLNALIYDITIPVGVKNFLFYGENAANGATEKQAKIDATWAGEGETAGTTKFAPYTILSDAQGWDGNNGAVANIENILNALHGYLTADAVKEYLKVETAALEALNTASSEHILALMNRIYNSIEEQIAAIDDDETLKDAIQGVLTNIQTYFDYANGKLTWKEAKDPQFPTKFNLPAGAVAVDYTIGDGFSVLEASSITADGAAAAAIADYKKFAYPPTLMYFANSPARTSNIPYLKEATETNWSDFVAQYAQNVVTSTTQSVVLENQVNFGMAQLKTKVKFAADYIIKDNAENEVTTTNPFAVTGILVGNQQGVKWLRRTAIQLQRFSLGGGRYGQRRKRADLHGFCCGKARQHKAEQQRKERNTHMAHGKNLLSGITRGE